MCYHRLVMIESCGACAGCEIDIRLRATMVEIDKFFAWKCDRIQAERKARGYDDGSDRRVDRAIHHEWSEMRMNAIRIIRPPGCLQPIIRMDAAH